MKCELDAEDLKDIAGQTDEDKTLYPEEEL